MVCSELTNDFKESSELTNDFKHGSQKLTVTDAANTPDVQLAVESQTVVERAESVTVVDPGGDPGDQSHSVERIDIGNLDVQPTAESHTAVDRAYNQRG